MRLLVVVAHPDDESFGCGSLLARAAAAGDETAVLCATRGEAGESRVVTDDLAAQRERELRDAARILGVGTVRLLDYADSGMTGALPEHALAAAGPTTLAADVRSVVDELQPDVVITLDAGDGHRDHAAIRDAALAAVDTARRPPAATYLWCLPRSLMRRWAEHVGVADGELGTPDDEITTTLDVGEQLATRWEAIRAHTSQASPYDDLPTDLQHAFLAVDRLRLVRGDDLLGG